MKWNDGKVKPKDEGMYLVRTQEGLAGIIKGYSVRYFARGQWYIDVDMKVTHWCVIEEPVEFEGLRHDPLGRLECVVGDQLVDRFNIGTGKG